MINIKKVENIDGKKHIALLDTSSISFMQGLKIKGIQPEDILKDYDLILIPEWVLTEINDAPGRANFVQELIKSGYPIYCIKEESYSNLTNSEEGNLYQIFSNIVITSGCVGINLIPLFSILITFFAFCSITLAT